MAVKMPLQIANDPATPASEASAEISLFRMTGNDGRCQVEFTFFERTGNPYLSPWVPVDPWATVTDQKSLVTFRPWYSRKGNAARLDAFWKGTSAAASLLGPIAEFGGALFKGGDPYALKEQGQRSFLEFTQDIQAPTGINPTRELTVSPSGVAEQTYTPKVLQVKWELQEKPRHGQAGAKRELAFEIGLEYLPTRLPTQPGASSSTVIRDLSGAVDTALFFQTMINSTSEKPGVAWRDLSDPIRNLAKQVSVETFGAACDPALADLARLGFSPQDQALLVYAIARGGEKQFERRELPAIKCFKNSAVTRGLRWFGITIPPSSISVQDRRRAASAVAGGFERPLQGGVAGPENLSYFLGSTVTLAGKYDLLTDGKSQPAPIFKPQPNRVAGLVKADFMSQLAALPLNAVSRCFAGGPNDNPAAAFAMPANTGLPAEDSAVPIALQLSNGTQLLLIAGLAGRNDDNYPVVNSLWVGDADDFNGPNVPDELNRMISTLRGDPGCTRFAAFLISGGGTQRPDAADPATRDGAP